MVRMEVRLQSLVTWPVSFKQPDTDRMAECSDLRGGLVVGGEVMDNGAESVRGVEVVVVTEVKGGGVLLASLLWE